MNYNHKLFNTLAASIVVAATIATVVFSTTVFAQQGRNVQIHQPTSLHFLILHLMELK